MRWISLLIFPVCAAQTPPQTPCIQLVAEAKYAEALPVCVQETEAPGATASQWVNRGVAHHRLKERAAARQAFLRALEVEPGHPTARTNLGHMKWEEGDRAGAMAEYNRAVEEAPKSTMVWRIRGSRLCEMDMNRSAECLKDLTRAIELDATNWIAFYQRGDIRAATGDVAGAAADYRRSLELRPGNDAVKKKLSELEAKSSANPKKPGFWDRLAAAEKAARDASDMVRGKAPVPAPAPTPAPAPAPAPSAPAPPALPKLPALLKPGGDVCAQAVPASMKLPRSRGGGAAPAAGPASSFTLPPYVDINRTASLHHKGLISAAMEGMRALYGPMRIEEQRRFEALWAPLFQYPTPAVIEYCRKLNPLLDELNALRSTVGVAGINYYEELQDAAILEGVGAGKDVDLRIPVLERQAATLQSLSARMEDVARQIVALGNPPDPFEEACKSARRHRKAVEEVQGMLTPAASFEGEWTQADGTRFYMKTLAALPSGRLLVYRFNVTQDEKLRAQGVDTHNADAGKGVPGILDLIEVWARTAKDQYVSLNYSLVPVAYHYRFEGQRATLRHYVPGQGRMIGASLGTAALTRSAKQPSSPPLPGHWTWAEVQGMAGQARVKDEQFARLIQSRPGLVETVERGALTESEKAEWYKLGVQEIRREAEQKRAAGGLYAAEDAAAYEKYETSILEKRVFGQSQQPLEAQAPAAPAPPPAGPDRKAEQVALHEERIAAFRKDLEADERALAAAKTERERQFLLWHMSLTNANIQGERDQITMLETGEWVHTRTDFDRMNEQRILQRSAEMAQRYAATDHMVDRLYRALRLFPEDQRAQERKILDSLLDSKTVGSADVERIMKIEQTMFNKLQGVWEGQAARHEEEALRMEEYDHYKQTGKTVAGLTIMYMTGGSAAFAAEFAGVTGLIEGGPKEAAMEAVSWAHSLGFVAAEGVRGYERGGLGEAAASAGKSFLFQKAAEVGVKVAARGWERLRIAFSKESQAIQREMQIASTKVNQYVRAENELAKARAAGAPPNRIMALEQVADDFAATVNASAPAKRYLQYRPPQPGIRRQFAQRVGNMYAGTTDDLLREMRAAGWDTSKMELKPLSNSGNMGNVDKVGQDLDLALNEYPGMRLMKNGQPMSRLQFQREAQELFNKLYFKRTGRSARASWLNVTTSAHAEAYLDKTWLGDPKTKQIDFSRVRSDTVPQAAEVTRYKANVAAGEHGLTRTGKVQEICRGTAKDLETKLLPYLDYKIAEAQKAGNQAAVLKLRDAQAHFKELHGKMANLGREAMTPMEVLTAEQELLNVTGGRSPLQAVDDMVSFWSELPKGAPTLKVPAAPAPVRIPPVPSRDQKNTKGTN
ncbi:MAG: tetratricopeptide repeat protein [Bryobacteraceae bacterium]